MHFRGEVRGFSMHNAFQGRGEREVGRGELYSIHNSQLLLMHYF